MPDFARCGMSMRTPAGSVDLVPLFRRLEGDRSAVVHRSEKEAAVLALAHLGVDTYRIGTAANVNHTEVLAILRARGVAVQPGTNAPAIGERSMRRQKRRSQRNLIDGRLVHPDAPHGTDTGYIDYGCQCVPCSAAHAAALERHRKARAS